LYLRPSGLILAEPLSKPATLSASPLPSTCHSSSAREWACLSTCNPCFLFLPFVSVILLLSSFLAYTPRIFLFSLSPVSGKLYRTSHFRLISSHQISLLPICPFLSHGVSVSVGASLYFASSFNAFHWFFHLLPRILGVLLVVSRS
jgi:hypothetical protein